jgi:hypothetical protein
MRLSWSALETTVPPIGRSRNAPLAAGVGLLRVVVGHGLTRPRPLLGRSFGRAGASACDPSPHAQAAAAQRHTRQKPPAAARLPSPKRSASGGGASMENVPCSRGAQLRRLRAGLSTQVRTIHPLFGKATQPLKLIGDA